MHVKEYHKRYNIDRHHRNLGRRSLKHFARYAATFGGPEGDEARRWLGAKRMTADALTAAGSPR